jgi:ribosomal protein S7
MLGNVIIAEKKLFSTTHAVTGIVRRNFWSIKHYVLCDFQKLLLANYKKDLASEVFKNALVSIYEKRTMDHKPSKRCFTVSVFP